MLSEWPQKDKMKRLRGENTWRVFNPQAVCSGTHRTTRYLVLRPHIGF